MDTVVTSVNLMTGLLLFMVTTFIIWVLRLDG